MKKKFPLIGCYLLAFLLACVGLTFTCSCDSISHKLSQDSCVSDTTLVEQCVYDYFNPTFTDAESVIEFQSGIKYEIERDSFIRSVNSETLRSIASVLLKRKEKVNISSLFDEYRCNRSVYDNLPDATPTPNPQIKTEETAVEEQHRRVDEPTMANRTQKSVTYTDTTINGKRCTIETRLYE